MNRLQNARHVGPVEAGLQLLPMTGCFPLGNLLYTRIHHRVGDGAIMAGCLGLAGVATIALLPASPDTPYWYLAVVLGLANSGAGLVTAALTAATVKAAGDEHAHHAGAMMNTNRQLGTLVGVALIGLILQRATDWYAGLHAALGVVAGAYLLASLTALATTRPDRAGAPGDRNSGAASRPARPHWRGGLSGSRARRLRPARRPAAAVRRLVPRR